MTKKPNIEKTTALLNKTEHILQKHQDFLLKNGEDFNIFNITKIERYENNTHSVMLRELLDPKGSHYQKNLFLKEFLKLLFNRVYPNNPETCQDKTKKILEGNPNVITEYFIGNVSEVTGGRIDIYIKSDNGNVIIENKIDAGDQKNQLVRYSHETREKDLLLYLTKFGEKASPFTAGNLKENEDFYSIGYYNEITEWLETTIPKINNEFVKNGVKQYLNLVKKITYQLENKFMDRLEKQIRENLVEAEAISIHLETTKQNIRNHFKQDVVKAILPLIDRFSLEFVEGNSVTAKYSQIWLKPKAFKNPALYFGIESFGGNPNDNGNGCLYYGVFNRSENNLIAEDLGYRDNNSFGNTKWWPKFEWAKDLNNSKVDLSSLDLLGYLSKEENSALISNHIANQVSTFLDTNIEDFNIINKKYSEKNA